MRTDDEIKYRNLFIEYWKKEATGLEITENVLEIIDGFLEMIHRDMSFEFREKEFYRKIIKSFIGNDVRKIKINNNEYYISCDAENIYITEGEYE